MCSDVVNGLVIPDLSFQRSFAPSPSTSMARMWSAQSTPLVEHGGFVSQTLDGHRMEIRCKDASLNIQALWSIIGRTDEAQACALFNRLGHGERDYSRKNKPRPYFLPYYHGAKLCRMFGQDKAYSTLLAYGYKQNPLKPLDSELSYIDDYFGDTYSKIAGSEIIVRTCDGLVNLSRLLNCDRALRNFVRNKASITVGKGPRPFIGVFVTAELALAASTSVASLAGQSQILREWMAEERELVPVCYVIGATP